MSKDVVTKMIQSEYDAKQAYEAFDKQLKQPNDDSAETILSLDRTYSNTFHKNDGSEAYSVMANPLRECFGSDVLVAHAYCFTVSVLSAEFTEKEVYSWTCSERRQGDKRRGYVQGFLP